MAKWNALAFYQFYDMIQLFSVWISFRRVKGIFSRLWNKMCCFLSNFKTESVG